MTTARPAGDGSGVDLWQLAGLPGGLRLASYLTASGPGMAAQYRLIVDVLLDQQQHTLTGVPHDILAALVAERAEQVAGPVAAARLIAELRLPDRMNQLADWQVVDAWDVRPTATRISCATPAATSSPSWPRSSTGRSPRSAPTRPAASPRRSPRPCCVRS